MVLICSVRASRSLPFVSKMIGYDLADMAARILAGQSVEKLDLSQLRPQNLVGVKAANFSWVRVPGADPLLGVDMQSTGEVG